MDPKNWLLFGVDLKKVELGMIRPFGVKVATTMEDAATVITFVQKVMMDRYEEMEKIGINNWDDMPENKKGPAIYLLIDEAGELFGDLGKGKDDETKMNQEYQAACNSALASIARLR